MDESTIGSPTETQESFLHSFESRLSLGADIGVAADFDSNISRSGPSNGLDPRDSTVDPVAREAISGIIRSGRDVVIISSRGARDVARIVDIPGISIVGSLGWETLHDGESRIHPKFDPYQEQITAVLGDVRKRLFADLGVEEETSLGPNVELPTPGGGKIILQRKGYNEEYPEGINLTWALNMLDPQEKEVYFRALKEYYSEAFEKVSSGLPADKVRELAQLCGQTERRGAGAQGSETLDFEIRPLSQASKSKALIQLMRQTDDPKRNPYFSGMPYHRYWIFSGDHAKQDGPVMRAGHLANALTNERRGGLGVWSKPDNESEDSLKQADVVVPGVSGNAELLRRMGQVCLKYPVTQ